MFPLICVRISQIHTLEALKGRATRRTPVLVDWHSCSTETSRVVFLMLAAQRSSNENRCTFPPCSLGESYGVASSTFCSPVAFRCDSDRGQLGDRLGGPRHPGEPQSERSGDPLSRDRNSRCHVPALAARLVGPPRDSTKADLEAACAPTPTRSARPRTWTA